MESGNPGVLPLGLLIISGDSLTSDSTGVKGGGGGGSVSQSFYVTFRRE